MKFENNEFSASKLLEELSDNFSFQQPGYIHNNEHEDCFDFVVLNSVSFFETARPFMEKHNTIRLYLDRDKTGQNYSRYALSLNSKYKDESNLYQNHKDLNDWVMNFGKPQKKHVGQKLR